MYVQYAHDDITNFEVCGLFTDKNIESKTFFFFFSNKKIHSFRGDIYKIQSFDTTAHEVTDLGLEPKTS